MVYQGGKFRQSKVIAPIINQCIKENNIENYYEPFVGGANILDKIICKNYYANDIDQQLIAFYQYIKDGGEPLSTVEKEEYQNMKDNQNKYPDYLLGNIKYMASFGGKPWGGYVGIDKRNGHKKYDGALVNFKKQIPILKQTIFSSVDYRELTFEKDSIIVCDPPYKGTTGYRGINFDSETFYEWFRKMSKEHYCVLCEYSAPEDFTLFKAISVAKTLSATDNVTKVNDGLFYCDGLFKDWYESIYKE